jgi:hypothetical protein
MFAAVGAVTFGFDTGSNGAFLSMPAFVKQYGGMFPWLSLLTLKYIIQI